MKFQKGLLDDLVPEEFRKNRPVDRSLDLEQRGRNIYIEQLPDGGSKDHLFETLAEESNRERSYLKVFGVVVLAVIVLAAAVFYLTLPGKGDVVRAPAGLELAVRDHFLTAQKRTATDIIFYQCDGYYDARVGVETRNDLPNPLFQIGTYSARATEGDGRWEITAAPVDPPAAFVACR